MFQRSVVWQMLFRYVRGRQVVPCEFYKSFESDVVVGYGQYTCGSGWVNDSNRASLVRLTHPLPQVAPTVSKCIRLKAEEASHVDPS